jgi:hypothetical protein
MKVKYKHLIKSYQGKKDGLVYYYHPGIERCIAREYVVPRATENNLRMKAVAQNLKALNPSQGWREDLKVYLSLLKTHAKTENAFNGHYWSLYTKLMWQMARQMDIDLREITREQIYAQEMPCISVKRAVEAGLLPAVGGYEILDREF